MAAMRIDCVMQFKCCDRTGQCSDTVGQRGFTVNSRKHCHISTTDFCDTLKQAAPAGKVRVGCWVPMSKLHFIKTRQAGVLSSQLTYNCSLTQSCENVFRFIFTFRWKMKIYAILRKSAEKKPQLLNIIPCI